jgi:hypothetical protein
MARIPVLVVAREPGLVDSIAEKCASHGMSRVSAAKTIGVVHGEIDEAALSSLREIDGVASVEAERTINLPPPGHPQ